MDEWVLKSMRYAHRIMLESKDPSTRVGCAIAHRGCEPMGCGRNGAPKGFDDDHEILHKRPQKYHVMIHAEINAIINTLRVRSVESLLGATAFVTLRPCGYCTSILAHLGVKEIYYTISKGCGEGVEGRYALEFASADIVADVFGMRINRLDYSDKYLEIQ